MKKNTDAFYKGVWVYFYFSFNSKNWCIHLHRKLGVLIYIFFWCLLVTLCKVSSGTSLLHPFQTLTVIDKEQLVQQWKLVQWLNNSSTDGTNSNWSTFFFNIRTQWSLVTFEINHTVTTKEQLCHWWNQMKHAK